jgi:hypothetical protein
MVGISVIIPVYKVEPYLRQCLESVLAQTYTDWEAICVNDGSPDNCPQILREYAARDSRIVVIDQENGGLSDARNTGMQHTSGKYVMYLDSDDFIHPQTMEIAAYLIEKEGTDIVSWYKDNRYRLKTLVHHHLGRNTDSVMPYGIKKRYHPERVKRVVTQDVYAHAVEYSHSSIKDPIKHCYVWKYLFKRELIADIPFIKGLSYEDFPWWSEVMLKNPSVTITQLPLYYYRSNFHSITAQRDQLKKLYFNVEGLKHTYPMYQERATEYQRTQWERNFMWAVVHCSMLGKIRLIKEPEERAEARRMVAELWEMGVFSKPTDKRERAAQATIRAFLDEA